ncbi:ammonium transporter [Cellulomonas chengniuliangii]|uniref:Ammonium transporter n=1 Tax=Cellulomonas chengniuliangii TaxID=2968084 RepID=A0ABY5L2M3_9CELL|nr:ammonium transporter [Cellulomonas chengniuliangii]MCC2307417.1 ammonium transporter [Cellulomonas chengniuliangii]UUI75802.1 ammonium transporter [Cellulomonas chengniuliangii]
MNEADTAWVLVCAALVLFMTPGLAMFYAGMVRSRNTLTMMLQNIVPLGVISLTWVLLGYTLAFSNQGTKFLGALDATALLDIEQPQFHTVAAGVTIPVLAFVAYQMMFAVITPALLTGATAGRLKMLGWVVFLAVWSLAVYPQVARWLWHPMGWLADLGAQDWAGGMVVHASAGAAAIAVLLVVGRRRDWPHVSSSPSNLPLMLAGAGILWFGWFGFNAGDGLQADGIAAQALVNTHVAAAGGLCAWLLLERLTSGHATLVGAASGAVAGLATVTPCAGFVSTGAAIAIGVVAGLVCNLAVGVKYRLGYDDALDVIAVHFTGGVLGSILLGFFADSAINPVSADGLFNGGGGALLGHQVIAILSVVVFSFVLSWVIAALVNVTIGLRVPLAEQDDLDREQQGAAAYALSGVAVRGMESAGRSSGSGGVGGPSAAGAAGGTAQGRPGRQLVTALVDTGRVDALRDALLAAGAESIVLSDAAVYSPTTPIVEVFRGRYQRVDFRERLRVQAVVDDDHAAAVAAELVHTFGADPRSVYRQEVGSV